MQPSKKEQKQNLLPAINPKGLGLSLRKQVFFTQPKMTKILYSPANSPNRYRNKISMFSAYMENKTYQEFVDNNQEREIEEFLRQPQLSERDNKVEGRYSLVGRDAKTKYYQNYKNLSKIIAKTQLSEQNAYNDPSTLVLEATEKLGILPCCLGLVKSKGQSTQLCLKGQKFGDNYIKAISAGLKQATMIQKFDLSNNRITDIGFNNLVSGIGHSIIKLDLSFNKIVNIDQKLLNIILEPEAHLEYINFQGNQINDKSAEALFRSASYSKNIKYLNLRKNGLTKKCAQAIEELLTRSHRIQELYIGMNRINQSGAVKIIKGLESNDSLKVFDYCLNKLGESKNNVAKLISNLLTTNKTLLHVDFSSNRFSQEESNIIGQGLESNHKIYGFHFSGNHGFIDSQGFYQNQINETTSLHSFVNTHINSYDINFRRENRSFDPEKFKNVCWICEGWYEQTFKFNIPETASNGKDLVYIHFDFEEYSPRLINITGLQVKYKTMVPPKKYKYFFSWNRQQFTDYPNKKEQRANNKYKSIPAAIKLDYPLYYTYELYNEEFEVKVEEVSGRSGKPKKIVNDWDELVIDVVPRQKGLISKKEKKPWNYKDSIWAKQWKLEDEQLTRNCFERDWKCSKLMNFIKNQGEQDKVKQLLYSNYKLIKEIYRQYSSWSPFNGDIWAVSNNAFTEFCNQTKILSKDTPLKIIDLTFITTNSMSGSDWKGNGLVPERGLIRFQFMQALVRLAQQKFKKNGHSDSILGSVEMMIKDHISPMKGNNLCSIEEWRLKKYFIEQIDMLLKKYRPIFSELYRKNSKMKVKPGNKSFMCLMEFKNIIERIGIAGTQVLERDTYLAFNCSMMTQVDEIQNQRFMRMTQIQFIQSIARCAYILPNTYYVEQIFQQPLPFHAKLQWIIHQMKKLCSDDIRDKFSDSSSIFRPEDK